MPILWQTVTGFFCKIVAASSLAFIVILLTMQLDEIAHFAALGAPLDYLFWFIFYQVPYVLPIAIPLSCLIASFIVSHKLSISHEITALRSLGFSLVDVLTPIWLLSAFLAVGDFWITSELATHSHLQTNLLKNELRSLNPLLLLHNKHLMRIKGFYFEALGPSKVGAASSDIILAVPSAHQKRLHLIVAKKINASSENFLGDRLTLIFSKKADKEEAFDPLLIENIEKSHMSVDHFADLLDKKAFTLNNDYLQLALLLHRIEEQKKELKQLKKKKETKEEVKKIQTNLEGGFSEIAKRVSLALSAFTFTFMGSSFGLQIGRGVNHRSLASIMALTLLYLVAFFVAKGLEKNFNLALFLYFSPHVMILFFSLRALLKISRGREP